MKYQIFKDSILILDNGIPRYINSDDPRYSVLVSSLSNLDSTEIDVLGSATKESLPKGFRYENDCLYFYKTKVPASLEHKIHEVKTKDNYINFFLNINNRLSKKESSDLVKSLISGNLVPISKDGFVLYFNKKTEGEINNFLFLQNHGFVFSRNNVDIDLFLKENFKNVFEKKEFKKEIYKLINERGQFPENWLMNISLFLKNQEYDEYITIIKSRFLHNHLSVFHNNCFSELINSYQKNESGKFSSERFFRLIESDSFLDLFSKYNYLYERLIRIDLKDETPQTAHSKVNKEYFRVIDLELSVDLKIEERFLGSDKINNYRFDNHELILARNAKDLIQWGSNLGNCVGNGSFYDRIIKNKSFIIGLFRYGKIYGTIEVNSSFKIVQFEIRDNSKKSYVQKNEYLFVTIQNFLDYIPTKIS